MGNPKTAAHRRSRRLALAAACGAAVAAPTAALAQTDGFINDWYAAKAERAERGFDLNASYVSEDLYNLSGGTRETFVHAGQIALNANLDLEKLWGWKGAKFVGTVTLRDGENINNEAGVSALFGPQEIYGRGHVVRLTQFWLDQDLAGGKVQLRLGRLNPGADFQDGHCNNLNLSFCANQAGNFVADYWYNWPISNWGAVATVHLNSEIYVKAGAYQINPNALRFGLGSTLKIDGGVGTLLPFELGWTPQLGGLAGTYKIGGWYSTADRADVYRDIDGAPAAATGLAFLQRDSASGLFLSASQQLTSGDGARPESGLKGFFRVSIADKATSPVDRTIAMGLAYQSPFASRPDDEVSLSLAFNHLNDRLADYRAERIALGATGPLPGDNETTVEAYYTFRVNQALMIRPDIQWIHNPGGVSSAEDAVIVGARTVLAF